MPNESALLQVAAADHKPHCAALRACVDALQACQHIDALNRRHDEFWKTGAGGEALRNAQSVLRGMDGRGA